MGRISRKNYMIPKNLCRYRCQRSEEKIYFPLRLIPKLNLYKSRSAPILLLMLEWNYIKRLKKSGSWEDSFIIVIPTHYIPTFDSQRRSSTRHSLESGN